MGPPCSVRGFWGRPYGGGICALYGHLKEGSIEVSQGDRVLPGQVLGRVGNSGASGMPHLHWTMLDLGYFSIPGRFRYHMQEQGRWREVIDADLRGGIRVRNIPEVEAASGSHPDAD